MTFGDASIEWLEIKSKSPAEDSVKDHGERRKFDVEQQVRRRSWMNRQDEQTGSQVACVAT
jgi:hypothetical protein